jgi:hypothetical protein
MRKWDETGSNSFKQVQRVKWAHMGSRRFLKWAQTRSNRLTPAEISIHWLKLALTGLNWFKPAQIGSNRLKQAQTGSNRLKQAHGG